MIKAKTILAVVSACSGSKSLLRKELRLLSGKSLIAWSLECALGSKLIDKVVISTADREVAAVAQRLRAELPARALGWMEEKPDQTLADCALSALNMFREFDYVVMLDSAAPLRLSSDIDCALEVSARNEGAPVVTVSEARFQPDSLVVLDGTRRMSKVFENKDILPGNGLAKIYSVNNAIAIASQGYLRRNGTFFSEDTHAYIIPPERALCVDSKTDLAIAEGILNRMGSTNAFMVPPQGVPQSGL